MERFSEISHTWVNFLNGPVLAQSVHPTTEPKVRLKLVLETRLEEHDRMAMMESVADAALMLSGWAFCRVVVCCVCGPSLDHLVPSHTLSLTGIALGSSTVIRLPLAGVWVAWLWNTMVVSYGMAWSLKWDCMVFAIKLNYFGPHA